MTTPLCTHDTLQWVNQASGTPSGVHLLAAVRSLSCDALENAGPGAHQRAEVAVFLLLMLALLIVLAWGLMGMAKGNGKLVIKTTTAAIPPKIEFHIEYTPPDHPPVGSPDALPVKGDPEVTGSGGDRVRQERARA